MTLFNRLKSMSAIKKCVGVNLAVKNQFHSISSRSQLLLRGGAPTAIRRTYVFKMFRKPSQQDLKIKDDIPDAFLLIYRNTMSKYIVGAQIITLIAAGLVMTVLVFRPDYENYRRQTFQPWSPTAKATKNEDLFYIGFFVTLIVLIQILVSRTPTRIYKVPRSEKYVSISYRNVFGKDRFTFKRGEIYHLEERGILPWRDNKYAIETDTNRRIVILLDHYFRRPADLSIMLGEQKDPDLDD